MRMEEQTPENLPEIKGMFGSLAYCLVLLEWNKSILIQVIDEGPNEQWKAMGMKHRDVEAWGCSGWEGE